MTDLALGVDLGNHGARAVVLEGDEIVATTSAEFGPPRPPTRRNAREWFGAFDRAVAALERGLRDRIGALAITGVRGAVVGVDDRGIPVTPGYPDFDNEAIATARQLVDRFGDAFLARTACFAFPLAGLPKMMLHAGGTRVKAWLGPADFVGFGLSDQFTLSAASAFRFGILRADATGVDHALLLEVGVDGHTIPPLVPVGEPAGLVATIDHGLRAGVRIVAAPGDVPAALYAVAGEQPGCAFVNLGTTIVATVALATTGVVPGMSNELLPDGRRAIETGSGAGVATLEWCAALLGTTPDALDVMAATARADAIPTLDPELLDPWGRGGGGALYGIVPDTGPAEIAAATLEAVARAASDALDELVAGGGPLDRIVIGGGASNCAPIVERLARLRTEEIVVAAGRELAAEGAARVAARWLSHVSTR